MFFLCAGLARLLYEDVKNSSLTGLRTRGESLRYSKDVMIDYAPFLSFPSIHPPFVLFCSVFFITPLVASIRALGRMMLSPSCLSKVPPFPAREDVVQIYRFHQQMTLESSINLAQLIPNIYPIVYRFVDNISILI